MSARSRTTTATQVERPDEQLLNLLREHGHCDLLLNRFVGHPLRDDIAAQTLAEAPRPINPRAIRVDDEDSLLLVRLRAENAPLLLASLAIAQRRAGQFDTQGEPVCAWAFGARTSLAAICTHLERQLIVRDRHRQAVVLRYYDPRVMSRLRSMLDAGQFAILLAPYASWSWLDREARLQVLARPASAQTYNTSLASLQLTEEQDIALDRLEPFQQALSALHSLGRPWPMKDDARLDAWLQDAAAKGHVAPRDQVSYALHCALITPDFDQIPAVAAAIVKARGAGHGLAAALDEFDDEAWPRLLQANASARC